MEFWPLCKNLFSSLVIKFSVSVLIVASKCDSRPAFMMLLTSYMICDEKIFLQDFPVICAKTLGICF